VTSSPDSSNAAYPRVLGHYTTGRPGPTIVVTGGIHGNEPAGCEAMLAVLARLTREQLPLRGELWAVAGNLRGLAANQRYLDRDLNRRWIREDLARIVANGPEEAAEDHEQLELLGFLAPLLERSQTPIVFFDLHSTSGPSAPFVCMADVLRNRKIALALGIPVVLGLEEVLDGSLLGYLCDLGHIGVAVEGGQHRDPMTVHYHESAVWLMLAAADALDHKHLHGINTDSFGPRDPAIPGVVEIRHRHVVVPAREPFVMLPGFANFQPVTRGQIVAHDARGPVHAPFAGLMMLPRYQGLGDDGFFIARAVSQLALHVSAALRRLHLDRVVPLLPGVRRHPDHSDRFIADPAVASNQVAHKLVVDLFHLFGYRHMRTLGPDLVFSRRAPGRALLRRPELATMAARATTRHG
jgi:succinylglutamate desuccinylase